jgi:hypothetical protein
VQRKVTEKSCPDIPLQGFAKIGQVVLQSYFGNIGHSELVARILLPSTNEAIICFRPWRYQADFILHIMLLSKIFTIVKHKITDLLVNIPFFSYANCRKSFVLPVILGFGWKTQYKAETMEFT